MPTWLELVDVGAAQARHWCFTLNNPQDEEWYNDSNPLPALPDERYVVWQLETGEEGTPHYQGYVEFSRPKRKGAVRRMLRAHWGARKASREAARDYCRKEDTRVDGPWERGAFNDGGQGKRNDLADAVQALKAGGMKRVAQEHPTSYVKFARGLKALEEELREDPRDEDFEPRGWQLELLSYIVGVEPDDRTIIWVTDEQGGRGKSRLARYLLAEHGAAQLEGKVADMAFAYNREPIVIFDITRAQAEHSDHLYTFAEKLKNGVIFATKYESRAKRFKPPHVIFFSNSPPDTSKWTRDRLIELNLADAVFAEDEAAAQEAQDAAAPFL